VDKKSRLILQNQGELEDQEVQVVEVPEDVDVGEIGVAMEVETEEVMVVNVEEATVTEEEDMAEKEEDADMVDVEVVIGREDMEEVQTATGDHVEVDSVEAVDMEVADTEAVVLEVVGMKVAEEVVRKEFLIARASRQPLIRCTQIPKLL